MRGSRRQRDESEDWEQLKVARWSETGCLYWLIGTRVRFGLVLARNKVVCWSMVSVSFKFMVLWSARFLAVPTPLSWTLFPITLLPTVSMACFVFNKIISEISGNIDWFGRYLDGREILYQLFKKMKFSVKISSKKMKFSSKMSIFQSLVPSD